MVSVCNGPLGFLCLKTKFPARGAVLEDWELLVGWTLAGWKRWVAGAGDEP